MKILMLIVAVVTVCAFGQLNATNYYMSPTGNDGAAGTFAAPWATFAQAVAKPLHAGDTLFVMGGTYTAAEHWYNGPSGTTLHPIVIKAYGDAVATFTNSGTGDYAEFFEVYNYAESHIVIDGESHLKHSPYPTTTRFLVFKGWCFWGGMFMFENFSSSNMIHGIVVRNCEIDGGLSGGTSALYMVCCDSFVVENNYMHDTGPAASGDEQGSPDLMWLMSCRYGKVLNNRFEHGNHACIDMSAPYGVCRYITFSGNVFNNGWGGGLYLMSSQYCLVDNNLFLHSGESTHYSKPAIQMNSEYNSIRRNVFYNPLNQGLFLAGSYMTGGAGGSWVQHNYIYNNTFFHNYKYASISMLILDTSDQPYNSVENNHFYNNILYKSLDRWNVGTGFDYECEVAVQAINSNSAHNWTNPPWGGNRFYNNLFRHDSRGLAKDSMVAFAPQGGGVHAYKIPDLQASSPTYWSTNIGDDPKLASESPDAYGTGWWYLKSGSPCINAGIAVVDSNGIKVQAVAPGYGWGNLTHSGFAPDIGAYEWGGENPSPPSVPPLSSFPGRK